MDLIGAAYGGDVHDAAAFRLREDVEQPLLLLLSIDGARDFEEEILPLDASLDDACVLDAELAAYIIEELGRRGGGERQNGRAPQLLDRVPQLQVRGTKVVTPLRDAMSLVHHEQRNRVLFDGSQMLRILQALGCNQYDVVPTAADLLLLLLLLARRDGRIQP
jgi:hypothetical protein